MTNKGGRPQFNADPHRKQVKAMAAYGIPQAEIARVIGCDAKTLRKWFEDELATGATEANAKVAESLYRKALGEGQGAVTAAIFWAKTRMGWKDTQTLDLKSSDGSMTPRPAIDTSRLSDDALAEVYAAMAAQDDEAATVH